MRASTPLFAADYRSLVLFRIAMCMWVLRDLFRRWYFNSIEAFLTSDGVLGSNISITDWKFDPIITPILFYRGSLTIQYIFFFIHFLNTLLLLFGYNLTLTSIINYLLILGMHKRNDVINDGSDRWLRCFSFLFIFSSQLSSKINYKTTKNAKNTKNVIHVFGSNVILLQFQTWIIYMIVIINRFYNHKVGSWFPYNDKSEYCCTSVYLAVTQYRFSTNIGYYVGSLSPYILYILCCLTTILEIICPTLLFFCNYDIIRYISMILIFVMHLGFNICIRLESFLYTSTLALILFIPTSFWEYIQIENIFNLSEKYLIKFNFNLLFKNNRKTRLNQILSTFFLIYLSLLNLTEKPLALFPSWDGEVIAKYFSIGQNWNMFGPDTYYKTTFDIVYIDAITDEDDNYKRIDLLRLLKTNWNETYLFDIKSYSVPFNPMYRTTFRRWERHLGLMKKEQRKETATYFCYEFYKYHQNQNIFINNTKYKITDIKNIALCKFAATRLNMWKLNSDLWKLNRSDPNDYRPFYSNQRINCSKKEIWDCKTLIKNRYNKTDHNNNTINSLLYNKRDL